MRYAAPVLAICVFGLSLAACSSGQGSNPSSVPCSVPAGTQVQLLYPIPSATAVPDSPQQIVIGASSALPVNGNSAWDVVLDSNTQTVFGNAFATISASQVPQPSATPSFPNAVYQSSTLPGPLSAMTAYTVYLNDSNSFCVPAPMPGGNTFTTQ